MYGYIYKTTNLINGKIYIGQHKHRTFDKNYMGSGKILRLAINKEGKENFNTELICEAANKQDLDNLEKYWIKKLNTQDPNIGYNIAYGGNDGNQDLKWCNNGVIEKQFKDIIPQEYSIGRLKMPESQKDKLRKPKTNIHKKHISAAKQGKIWVHNDINRKQIDPQDLNYYLNLGWVQGMLVTWERNPLSDETKRKISEGNKGKIISKEQKEKISNTIKKTTSNIDWKLKHSKKMKAVNGVRGKHWYNNGTKQNRFLDTEVPEGWIKGKLSTSEDTRKKISNACKGRKRSIETRQKISLNNARYMRGKIPGNAIKIICIETGQIFDSYQAASKYFGITFATIKSSIENKKAVGNNKYSKEKWTFKLWEN